jgi:hypothetical protein
MFWLRGQANSNLVLSNKSDNERSRVRQVLWDGKNGLDEFFGSREMTGEWI